MFTQFITILILVSIVGCILYGRRLIKTEKLMLFLVTLKELKVVLTGLLLEVVRSYLFGFIIHGILLKDFIQNLQMNYARLLK